MLEKLYHEDMEESEPRLLTTVLTCEGDLRDPAFPFRLQSLVCKLKRLISEEKKPFWVTKIEPWNSVRVTFTIPHEAALRLRQLAEQGDQVLRDLGILSVQIEGDQVITLTLANRYSEPQEIVFKTSETQTDHISDVSRLGSEGVDMNITSKSVTRTLEHQLTQAISSASGPGVSRGANEAVVRLGPERNFVTDVSFRSPNVVAPNSSNPLPFKTSVASSLSQKSVSKKQTNLGPFPFASMTYAMNTKHAAANQQNAKPVQGCSSRFPFTPPLQRSASSAWKPYISHKNATTASSSISVVSPPTAVINSQPVSCTSSPGLLSKFPNTNFSSNLSHISPPNAIVTKTVVAESSKASVVLSSPLLVNLLQNETSVHVHSSKIAPPPSNPSTQPPVKRRRKPRKSKEKLFDSELNSQFSPSPRTPSSTSSITTDFDQMSSKNQPFRTLPSNILSSPIPHIHPQAEGQPQVHTGNLPLHTHIPFRTVPVSNFPLSTLQNRVSPPRYGAPPVCTANTSHFTSKISSPIKESEKIKVTSDSTPFPSPPPSADGKIKHLINPFTGQLEPMPSDEDEDECIGSLSLFPELEMMDTNESGSSDKHSVENDKDNICSSYYEKGKPNAIIKSSGSVILNKKANQSISTNQGIIRKEEVKPEKQNCAIKQLNKEQKILSNVNTCTSKTWKKVDSDRELSSNVLSVCHSDFAVSNGEHNVPCSEDWKLQTLLASQNDSYRNKNPEGESISTKNILHNRNSDFFKYSQINSAYIEDRPKNSGAIFQNKMSCTTQEVEKDSEHVNIERNVGLERHTWKTISSDKRQPKSLTVLQMTGIKADAPFNILGTAAANKKQKANSNESCHAATTNANICNKPYILPVHVTQEAVTSPIVPEINSTAYSKRIDMHATNNTAAPSIVHNSVPLVSDSKSCINFNHVEVSNLSKMTENSNQLNYHQGLDCEIGDKRTISATSQFPSSSSFHNTESNQSKYYEDGSLEKSCSPNLQGYEENECHKDKFAASGESKRRDIYQTSVESPKVENGVENGISSSPKSEDSLPSVMCDTPDSHTTIGASSCDQDVVIGLDANLNSGLEYSRQLSDINEGEELKYPLTDKAFSISLTTQPHFETPPDSRSPISLGVTAHDRLPPEQVINTLEMIQKGGILIDNETKSKNKSECRNLSNTMHSQTNGMLDSGSCGQEQNVKDIKTRIQYSTVPVSHHSKLTISRENAKHLGISSRGCLKMQSSFPSAKSDHAYFNANRQGRDNFALADLKNMENGQETRKLLSPVGCTPFPIPNLHKIYVASEKQEFESKSDIPIDIGDINKVKNFKTDKGQQKIASVAKIISLNCLTDQKSAHVLVVPSVNKLQNFTTKSMKKNNLLELSAIPSLIPSDGNVVHNLRLPIQEDVFEEMLLAEGNNDISPPQYSTFSTPAENNGSKPYVEENNQFHSNGNLSSVEFTIHNNSISLNDVSKKSNAFSKSCLTQEIDNVDSQSSEESSLDSIENNQKDLTSNSHAEQKEMWNTSNSTGTTLIGKYPQQNPELQRIQGFPTSVLTSASLEDSSFKSVVSKCQKGYDKNTSLQQSTHREDKLGLEKHLNSSKGQLSESSHKIFDFNDSNISKPPEQLPLEIFENSESESQSPAASVESENIVSCLNIHQQLHNVSDTCLPISQSISFAATNVESHPSSHISNSSAMITKIRQNILDTAALKSSNTMENLELQKLASKCVVSNKEISSNSSCLMTLDTSSSEPYESNLYCAPQKEKLFQSTNINKTLVTDWLATTSSANVLVPVSTSTSVPIRLVTLPSSVCGQFVTDNLIEARTTSSLSFPAYVNNSVNCASSRLVSSKSPPYPNLVSAHVDDTTLNTRVSETVKSVESNRISFINTSLQNCLVNSTVDSAIRVNSSIAVSSDSYLRLLNSTKPMFTLRALEETEKNSMDNGLFGIESVKEDENKNITVHEKQMESNNLENISNSLGMGKSSVFAKNNAEPELPLLQFRTVPHKSFSTVDDRLVNEIKQKLNISKELKHNVSTTANSLVLCNLSDTKNYSNKKCLALFSDKSFDFVGKKPNCSYYDELSKCFSNKSDATNSQNQLNKYQYRLTVNGTDPVRPECADGVHTVLKVNDMDVNSVHINSKRNNVEPKLNTSLIDTLSAVSDSRVVSQLTQKSLETLNSGKTRNTTCAIVELHKPDVFGDRELFNSKRKYHIFHSRTAVVDHQEEGDQKEDIGLNGRPHFLGCKLSEYKRKMCSESTFGDEDLSNVKRRRQSSDSLR